MEKAKVDALDHPHVVQVDMKTILLDFFELASVVTGEPESGQAVPVAPFDRVQDVRAVAGATDCNQDVSLAAVVHQLLNEDLVVGQIIADGHDPSRIVGQAEHLESLLVFIAQ